MVPAMLTRGRTRVPRAPLPQSISTTTTTSMSTFTQIGDTPLYRLEWVGEDGFVGFYDVAGDDDEAGRAGHCRALGRDRDGGPPTGKNRRHERRELR